MNYYFDGLNSQRISARLGGSDGEQTVRNALAIVITSRFVTGPVCARDFAIAILEPTSRFCLKRAFVISNAKAAGGRRMIFFGFGQVVAPLCSVDSAVHLPEQIPDRAVAHARRRRALYIWQSV